MLVVEGNFRVIRKCRVGRGGSVVRAKDWRQVGPGLESW